ncbi:MAG: hypothetical protein DRJ59_00200 [Thermoprotei archaeon]|nr:MAG: hypothetical protein DRJ59_00200 [Thermoprotei archaeon]
MIITFLGTAGSAPYHEHSLPSILVSKKILLDCGEGATSALQKAGALDELEYVLLTHFHGDHVSGLISLIWIYMLRGRARKLTVIGPRGVGSNVIQLLKLVNTPMERIRKFLVLREIKPGENIGFIFAEEANHPTPSLAFRIEIEGRALCYTGDTSPSEKIIKLAKGCELLIHDATFPPGMEEEALAVGHSTPYQAAVSAQKAGVKKLVLFHLPYYYFGGEEFIKDYLAAARKVFSGEIYVPREFEIISI